MVVNNGGIAALMNVISSGQDLSSPVAAVLAIGYIAAMSPALALSAIQVLRSIIDEGGFRFGFSIRFFEFYFFFF